MEKLLITVSILFMAFYLYYIQSPSLVTRSKTQKLWPSDKANNYLYVRSSPGQPGLVIKYLQVI